LRTGEFVPIFAEGRRIAYLRHLEGQRMLIAINAGETSWELNLPVSDQLADGTLFEDVLGGDGGLIEEGHFRKRTLSPWEGAIFKTLN
ncbi:MAG: hypothetical protein ACK2TV_16440, partial [Anaerolineales bacterium]